MANHSFEEEREEMGAGQMRAPTGGGGWTITPRKRQGESTGKSLSRPAGRKGRGEGVEMIKETKSGMCNRDQPYRGRRAPRAAPGFPIANDP
jgi:hypothetical protein